MSRLQIGHCDVTLSFSSDVAAALISLYNHSWPLSPLPTTRDVRLDIDPIEGFDADEAIIRRFPRCRTTRCNPPDIEDGLCIEHARFQGVLKKKADQIVGRFCVAAGDRAALSILLETCVVYATVLDGGILLHASGVCRDGRLFLFSGPSESGKTTIARRLTGGGRPFCVEACCLFPSEGRVVAFPTPLSDFDGDVAISAPKEVGLLAFIEQAAKPAVFPLTSSEGALRILNNIRYLLDDVPSKTGMLATVSEMVAALPCCRLQFSLDETFWGILEQPYRR